MTDARQPDRFRLAIAGDPDHLGPVIVRRLAGHRAVATVHWVAATPPGVAGPNVRWGPEPGDCDVAVLLPGAGPAPWALAARHVVVLHPAYGREPWPEVPHEATRLRYALPLGARMGGAAGLAARRRRLPDPGVPLGLVWDEDVAEAVALAIARRPSGRFDLVAGPCQDATTLAGATGWRTAARPDLRPPDDMPPLDDGARAAEGLGWRPRFADAAAVIARYHDLASPTPDPRIKALLHMVAFSGKSRKATVERIPDARIGLRLTGPGGGDFGLILGDGAVRVAFGPLPEPTSMVTLPAATLIDLLAERTTMPTLQFSGRLRVEGDAFGIAVLASIVQGIHRVAVGPPPMRWAVAAYLRWIGHGAPS